MERKSRNPTLPNVDASRQLGNLLIRKGLIAREQLSQALQEQRDKGGRLGEVLVRLQILDELTPGATLAKQPPQNSVAHGPAQAER